MKRSRLSPQSAKRRAAVKSNAAAMDARREWATEFMTCAVCGSPYLLETHEIASKGITSNGGWLHECAYLRTCRECHSEHFSWLPEVVQCAVKAIVDPSRSDPAMICKLRHRAETAITGGEVEAWKRFLLSWRGR